MSLPVSRFINIYTCAVCNSDVREGRGLITLACGHVAHTGCRPGYDRHACLTCLPPPPPPPVRVSVGPPLTLSHSVFRCVVCNTDVPRGMGTSVLACGHVTHFMCNLRSTNPRPRCLVCAAPPPLAVAPDAPPVTPPVSDRVVDEDCAICMYALSVGGAVVLRCGHRFHAMCLSRLVGNQQRCALCLSARDFPSQLSLRDSAFAETQALRTTVGDAGATEAMLREEIASLKGVIDSKAELMRTRIINFDSENQRLVALNTALQSRNGALRSNLECFNGVQAENCFLREEINLMRERELSFQSAFAVADTIVSMSARCTNERAAIASELADDNKDLLIGIGHAEARRGYLFRRVVDERDGLVSLVNSLSDDAGAAKSAPA